MSIEGNQCDVEGCKAKPKWIGDGPGPSDFLGLCDKHKRSVRRLKPDWAFGPYPYEVA